MIKSLIERDQFIGLQSATHLAAGGETPMLKSHQLAIEQFMEDKGRGELARELEAETALQARARCGQLLGVDPDHITFLSNATEGINTVLYGLDWKSGDNVVVVDVEFPSGLLPWTRLESRGVEVRVVRHRDWVVNIEDIAAMIDERTRVVEISHVSMFTGQRIDLARLSGIVRASNALLLLDATHAAGVVPVDAALADIVVSSCYKWLLGVHGAAIFYVNRERLPDFSPPFLGWNNPARLGGWESPLDFTLKSSADAFQPGNCSFISVYILNNALQRLLAIGNKAIEDHALALSGRILDAMPQDAFELMTPRADAERAGNVCFVASDPAGLRQHLESREVYIWGTYAGARRMRISTHVYNDSHDVDRCIEALHAYIGQ